MLKLLLKDAIKSPGKLLALCIVMYLASLSFFVAGFLVLLAARWIHKTMKQKVKAIETAEAEAEAEAARIEAEKLAAAAKAAQATKATVAAANVASATGAANDNTAEPMSTPRYAKSAVVLPFKTGTL
jgi:uncharacterized protein YdaU (DUF1376 family)